MDNIKLIRAPFDNKEGMTINEVGNVVFLTFPIFDKLNDKLIHGFSTRLGGVSEGIFSSMNLSTSRGDNKEAVLRNYHLICDSIGCDFDSLVTSDQTHTVNVRTVTNKDRGAGVTKERGFSETDGMITNERGVTLMTFYADCVPLFIYDPVNHAIGLSHSGWRGTVAEMGKITLEAMRDNYGTDPSKALVAIGPSICQDCYEVSEDVAEVFYKTFANRNKTDKSVNLKETASDACSYIAFDMDRILINKGNGKYQLDLRRVNHDIFLQSGVKETNIAVTDLCTCCNPDFLFSHRASQGKRGNLAAIMCLK